MSGEKKNGRIFSRRDFLKLTGTALGFIAYASSLPSWVQALSTASYSSERESLGDVEVYGLMGEIKTQEDFNSLYKEINDSFIEKLPLSADKIPSYEQRDIYWGKDRRILEVIVRKSDFENDPLSNDFTLRMKRQVDIMNRVLNTAKPQVDLQAKLARIIVVSDEFANHPAGFKYAADVDYSEFISDELGENQNYWSVNAKNNGELGVKWVKGAGEFDKEYILPKSTDSLSSANNENISYYLFHEWMHRLFNVPDEYLSRISGVNEENFRFRFWTIETGTFRIPHISPYIASVANWKAEQGIRGLVSHPLSGQVSQENITTVLKQRPNKINIKVEGASGLEVFSVKMQGGYFPSRNEGMVDKILEDNPDIKTSGNKITLGDYLFDTTSWHEPYTFRDEQLDLNGKDVSIVPTVYVIRAIMSDGKVKEVHLPVAAFFLSAVQGKLREATYNIDFTGNEIPLDDGFSSGGESLRVNYVDKSELDNYIKELLSNGSVVYATMQVDGTSTYFVWFQSSPISIKIPESSIKIEASLPRLNDDLNNVSKVGGKINIGNPECRFCLEE